MKQKLEIEFALWHLVELPADDVCVEDCSCSVLWEHCSHQAS